MTEIQNARLSRRSVVAGSLGVAGAALLRAAAPAAVGAQASGEVIVAARVSNYYVMNPLIGDQSLEWMMSNVTEPLLTYDRQTLAILPGLAESWEISPEETEYTFHLRQGVTWHDGAPFTSADVKFTVDTALLPETAFKYQETWSRIKEVQAPDELTVKFILETPFTALLASFVTLGIVPKHILEPFQTTLKEAPYNRLPVGTGPYMVTEHTEELVTFSANPNYYGEKAKIEKIHFRDVAAGVSAPTMLRTGAVDIVRYDPATMSDLADDEEFVLYTPEYVTNILRVHLNNNDPLFTDKRVRQALAYGFDRASAIAAYGQPAVIADALVPPGVWAFHQEVKKYPYDPEMALALLAEAGWTPNGDGKLEFDGQPFKFTITLEPSPGLEETAIVSQQNWQALGMEVDVQVAEWASWVSKVWESKDFQVAPMAWDQGIDPGAVLPSQVTCGANSNISGYCNAELDELLNQVNNISDETGRKAIFVDIQNVLAEDVPDIPVMSRLWQYLIRANIKGVVLAPTGTVLFDMNKWSLE